MSKRRRKTILMSILLILISSYATFYLGEELIFKKQLQEQEIELRMQLDDAYQEKKTVAVLKKDIDRYTLITEENLEQYVQYVEMNSSFLSESVVQSNEEITNKVINKPGIAGEILYSTSFNDMDSWLSVDDREKEIKVRYLVADTVQEGNIIDLIINYDNGIYDVVLSKKKVNKIINPYIETVRNDDGTLAMSSGKNPAARNDAKEFLIILNLNEEEYELVTMASKMGYFETRKYLDDSQKKSKVTFEITEASKQLGLNYQSKTSELEIAETGFSELAITPNYSKED